MIQNNKTKALIVMIAFLMLILPLMNALTLDTGTILNTSVSNSSMSFSVPISVTSVDVEDVNITLSGVVCSVGSASSDTIFWNTENTNYDSSDYCPSVSPALTAKSGFCANVTSGMDNFFKGIIVIFIILAVAIILGILMMVVNTVKGEDTNLDIEGILDNFPVKEVFLTILAVTILVFVILAVLGSLCI